MKSPLLSPFTVYTRIVISPLLTTPMKFPRSAEEYEFAPFSAKSSTMYVIPSISIISFSAPFMIPIIGVLSADGDIGKVIGKYGRIAKAMRTVLSASAVKDGKRYSLDILDN